jgi:AraC-like DNA-binding protein
MSMQILHRLGGYREFAPPADLADVVEVAWVYSRAPLAPAHRVLPETGVSIAITSRCDQDGRLLDADLIYIGPIVTARVFAPAADVCLEAVRLKPEWSRDILGVDPAEHFDATDPFCEPELLNESISSNARLQTLLDYIRTRRAQTRRRDGVAANVALEEIRSRAAVASSRHIRRLIRRETGLSPKQYQRVQRLNRAVAHADRTATPRWADIACAYGFYDQAHMVNEFRALTGLAPAALHAERRLEVRNFQYE